MSIRFAAAHRPHPVLTTGSRLGQQHQLAANDNMRVCRDTALRDALKHFAQHGLRAARIARDNALDAYGRHDHAAVTHWLGICIQLDRRMAAAVTRQLQAMG